ncbi:ABC transporter permease [Paenarthrobacter sp. RAF54_2]|uniref:ABC transporter permease n=1 Tax=Paenarthrobacter sp. RAF54_2 TaxID=3233061 RepID=UPI003F9C3205
MTTIEALVPTLLGVVLLVTLTAAVLTAYRVPYRWAPALAILRGTLQLAAISVILSGVISSPAFVALALLIMFAVAAATAARRVGWSWKNLGLVGGSMGLGIAVTLSIIFATGAVELTPRYALAIGGIIIGNAMTTATLAGRRFSEAVTDHWEEVEGWLALGATPRRSTLELARRAVYSALIPSIDQTKTTGLVTLPGAFVGAIFGGVSPLEAGRFQIVVLAGIMAAGAFTAVSVIASRAAVRVRPAPLDR